MGSGAMSLGLKSTRGLFSPSHLVFDSMPAFQISSDKKIPEKSFMRTSETSRNRMNSLMKMPDHKSGTSKFDSKTDCRTIAPLTSEDIALFGNIGLMNSLRSQQPSVTT